MTEAPRAWEGVLHHIEACLLSGELGPGELGPGDHLPRERALATELGVGRSSVREAVRVLDVLGLVRTQTGSGPKAGLSSSRRHPVGCRRSCACRSRHRASPLRMS